MIRNKPASERYVACPPRGRHRATARDPERQRGQGGDDETARTKEKERVSLTPKPLSAGLHCPGGHLLLPPVNKPEVS